MPKQNIVFSGHEQPDIPKLIDIVPNKFVLSIAVAKRAKQIKEGVKPMITVNGDGLDYPIDVALKEIEAGKIKITIKEKPLDESHVLDEMDQLMEKEMEAAVPVAEEDKKSGLKEKVSKSKSKSLAA